MPRSAAAGAAKVVPKARIGDAHGVALHGRLPAGEGAGYAREHAHAMVAQGVDASAAKTGWAVYDEAVGQRSYVDSHWPEDADHGGYAIGFLHDQLGSVADDGLTSGVGAENPSSALRQYTSAALKSWPRSQAT